MTYSPTSFDAVPLARRHLTAEFGMGSGVLLVLKPPDRKRSEIGVSASLRAFAASGSGRHCPRMLLEEGGLLVLDKLVCLLPDQIKPIERLVPVN